MSSLIIPFGSATVVVPAGEALAVASQGSYQIWQQAVGSPNQPPVLSILNDVQAVAGNASQQTVTSTFTNGATLVVYATGNQPVAYEVGTVPVVKQNRIDGGIKVINALNATGAVTAAMIYGGILTSTTAAPVAGTIPTGTVLDATAEWGIGEAVDWSVIATGANAFTVTAAAGHTIVGNAVVATVTTGRFSTVKSAANTFVTYRIG